MENYSDRTERAWILYPEQFTDNPTLRERQLDRSARAQALVNGSAFLGAHPDQPMCSAKHTSFTGALGLDA
jgi:hypothetical protein